MSERNDQVTVAVDWKDRETAKAIFTTPEGRLAVVSQLALLVSKGNPHEGGVAQRTFSLSRALPFSPAAILKAIGPPEAEDAQPAAEPERKAIVFTGCPFCGESVAEGDVNAEGTLPHLLARARAHVAHCAKHPARRELAELREAVLAMQGADGQAAGLLQERWQRVREILGPAELPPSAIALAEELGLQVETKDSFRFGISVRFIRGDRAACTVPAAYLAECPEKARRMVCEAVGVDP